jgi:hypothetical protein
MTQRTEAETGGLSKAGHRLLQLAALGAGVSLLAGAFLPKAPAGEACCGVLSVDVTRGVVNAFERESGNRFSFSVKDKALLKEIKPCQSFNAELAGATEGQAFAPDFGAASEARVNSSEPCCNITRAPGTAGRVAGVQPHAKYEGVDIILTELKRTGGDLVTATCLYCNGSPAVVSLASDFRARKNKAKLLDTENKVEYQVERPGGSDALVSDHGAGSKLQPNQSVSTWMKFTAPAGSTVTLIVPGAAEPFQDVAISK